MPNTAVLCSNFTKERRTYEHAWTYFVYNYISMSPELPCVRLLCFFFRFLLENEKTAKL